MAKALWPAVVLLFFDSASMNPQIVMLRVDNDSNESTIIQFKVLIVAHQYLDEKEQTITVQFNNNTLLSGYHITRYQGIRISG